MGWDDIGKDISSMHLSASQIGMYQRCPMQYEFRYMKGIKRPPDSGLIVGIAVHRGIEHNYKHKFEKKESANKNEVMDAFANEFDKSKVGAELNEDEGKAKDRGYMFTETHFEKVAPSVQPTKAPEMGFEISVQGVKRRVIGFIDLFGDITDNDPYAETRLIKDVILDNKTTRRTFTKWEADISMQLTTYAYSWYHTRKAGDNLGGVGFDVLAQLPSGRIKPSRAMSTRDKNQLIRFEKSVRTIEKAINEGIFYPTENHQHCSWCGYNGICHERAVKIKHQAKLG